MMGQPWQKRKKYSADEDIKEDEQHSAGYIDEPRKESYLPNSVHGSRRHMVALVKNALVLVLEFGCPHVLLTLTCNPDWPEIESQLINFQTAFDQPDATVPIFELWLDQFKTNVLNEKYFQSDREVYMFHVIEYHYQGLPTHTWCSVSGAIDCDQLFSCVDNFISELPHFQENEYHNIDWCNVNELTENFKAKALKKACKHNLCAVAINGCKKDASDRCRRGYSRTETIPETYMNQMTDRILYWHCHVDDL
jgi:hypothetical protein